MKSQKHTSNIREYRKKKHFNLGLFIFGFIFLYLIGTVILFVTSPHITAYEVRQGSILKDNTYTGLAIREETVVYAEAEGYINYYAQNNSKIGKGSYIYTLSKEKLDFENNASETDTSLTEEEKESLLMRLRQFNENFKEDSFSDTYLLKSEIEDILHNISGRNKSDQLNSTIANGNEPGMALYLAPDDGIVVFSVDGLESLTKDTVSMEYIEKDNSKKVEFSNNMGVNTGDPVYKLITSESWTLITELSESTAEALNESTYVKVHFSKDNQTLWANLEIKENSGKYLAYLSFDNSMIRYANERYLDFELILEDKSGLKIPKSAETTKDFYVVPKSYITQGGNSSNTGVLTQITDKDGKTSTEFVATNIYYEDEEIVYLDPNQFQNGAVLLKPESTEIYELKEKKSLKGVYNINKGYAVFKQINILCESDEYYIVEEGNLYGLSNYDRIALHAKKVEENAIVF